MYGKKIINTGCLNIKMPRFRKKQVLNVFLMKFMRSTGMAIQWGLKFKHIFFLKIKCV